MSAERRRRAGRRRALRTVVVVLAVVAAMAGGPWVYAQFFAAETPPPLTVGTTMTTPPPQPVGPVDPEGAWTVAEGSEAGYRIDEVLSGQEVTVVGRTEQLSGEILVEDSLLTAARVSVDVGAITTPESARDAYFRRALDTSTYPDARLETTAPVDVAGVGRPGQDVTVELPAALTLREVTVPVTVTAVVRTTADGLEVAGSAPITLADVGLSPPDLPFVTVQPTGTVEVLLQLRRPG